jgi:hypothetical protein
MKATMNRFTIGAVALLLSACGQGGDAPEKNQAAAGIAVPAQTTPAVLPGPAMTSESRTFRDWYAVCDNGNRCAAYTGGSTGWILIGMEAGGEGQPTVKVGMWPAVGGALPDPIVLTIDGRRHATTRGPADTASASLPAEDARTVVAELIAGRSLSLSSGGETLTLPVTGSSASLLWIDERQGRLDTVTALIRRGPKPASTVPAAPDLPVVTAASAIRQDGFAVAPPTDGDKRHIVIVPAAVEAVPAVRQCRADTDFNEYLQKAVSAARLDDRTELWGIPCDTGAYNAMYDFYVTGPGGANPRLALFPDAQGRTAPASEGDTDHLVNPVYDPRTRTMTAFAKGRGIGDCGVLQVWTWTGKAFALSREQVMSDCWGMSSDFWPTTYRSR